MLNAATLQAQQQALARAISGADTADTAAAALLLRPLRAQPPRLAVYRHAWRARLTEALRSNYSVLHAVLGDDGFAE